MIASVQQVNMSEWVKIRSADLEIVGEGYITHLSDFSGFKSSSG